ncbi:MAG: hypothetical protein AUK47_11945 [Deltaproteobacteria bacterium CG2_30_63_29]|nr:MAG: hypothetical protein AUK47_11945 [Deltaproteobacteria bacterium CG2_30_63_29]PJB33673.1 MAG: hypothetical protein CO108_30390 [Deltaproteobacteria bacterium CG_4_9_14_3_um_filter_63_12]
MDIKDKVQVLADELRGLGEGRHQVFVAQSAKTQMGVLGVRNSAFKGVLSSVKKELKKEPASLVLELADALIEKRVLELRQLAYEVVHTHKAALAAVGEDNVWRLGRGMDNWISVDTFSVLVAGPAWREGQLSDETVRGWTAHEDVWWRRTAVVSAVALNLKSRGGRGDLARTLEVCERVVKDHDERVVKALSWSLREASRRYPDAIDAFLNEHDGVLAARVKREVRNKLVTGLKNPKS